MIVPLRFIIMKNISANDKRRSRFQQIAKRFSPGSWILSSEYRINPKKRKEIP
jgi:hypothetical protein